MAEGSLTRHFGWSLIQMLAEKIGSSEPDFKKNVFIESLDRIESLSLMDRIHLIADSLGQVLPDEAAAVWDIQQRILGPPLRNDQQTFNDGYWMLPLADYWARHQIESFETSILALEELTRRGTSEFAVRTFFHKYPERMTDILKRWTESSCFHVRRLATEGSRPYLPWGGRLRVPETISIEYLETISVLKHDSSAYVRRSVGNHVRDWRRINHQIADRWVLEQNPPQDVLNLALPKKKR